MHYQVSSAQEHDSMSDQQEVKRSVSSRRRFLRGSVIGASLLVPASLLAACGAQATTTGSPSHTSNATKTDMAAILALPALANSKAAFDEIMSDENAHVTFLQTALTKAGATPRPKPTFKGLQQSSIMAFANVSQVFENVGVGAYLMAAPAISNKAYLAAAGSILTIEARHAGFLDALLSKPLSPNGAFDRPLTQAEIVQDVSPFIASLNGGSDPSQPLKNDADILNFALLLEFLEAEFYNTNVPMFFK